MPAPPPRSKRATKTARPIATAAPPPSVRLSMFISSPYKSPTLWRAWLRLHRQHGVDRRVESAAFNLGKAGLPQQGFVLGERAFLPLGADEHVEALHLRPARARLVGVEQFFGNEQGAAGRQVIVNAA